MPEKPTIFLSYCHDDSEWIDHELKPLLDQFDCSAIIDDAWRRKSSEWKDGILPGDDLYSSISALHASADLAFHILTTKYFGSLWCINELDLSSERMKAPEEARRFQRIQILLEDVDSRWGGELYVELTDFKTRQRTLVDAISALFQRRNPHAQAAALPLTQYSFNQFLKSAPFLDASRDFRDRQRTIEREKKTVQQQKQIHKSLHEAEPALDLLIEMTQVQSGAGWNREPNWALVENQLGQLESKYRDACLFSAGYTDENWNWSNSLGSTLQSIVTARNTVNPDDRHQNLAAAIEQATCVGPKTERLLHGLASRIASNCESLDVAGLDNSAESLFATLEADWTHEIETRIGECQARFGRYVTGIRRIVEISKVHCHMQEIHACLNSIFYSRGTWDDRVCEILRKVHLMDAASQTGALRAALGAFLAQYPPEFRPDAGCRATFCRAFKSTFVNLDSTLISEILKLEAPPDDI